MPNLINPHTGELQFVPDDQVHNLGPGWREETTNEEFDRYLEANRKAEYGEGTGNALEAIAEGVLSGATLGLSDVFDNGWGARQRAHYEAGWRALGELGGGLAPALLSGGASEAVSGAEEAGQGAGFLARVLKSSPAGWVGKGGQALNEALGEGRMAHVLSSAAEGAAFGMGGAFSQAQLSDDPLTAEALFHGAGLGALTGGALSLGFQGLGEAGRGLAKLRGAADEAVSAESPALRNFSDTWEEMRDYHAGPDPTPKAPPGQTYRGQVEGLDLEQGGAPLETQPSPPPTLREPPRFARYEDLTGEPEPAQRAPGRQPEALDVEFDPALGGRRAELAEGMGPGPEVQPPVSLAPDGIPEPIEPEYARQPVAEGIPPPTGLEDARVLNLTNPGKLGVGRAVAGAEAEGRVGGKLPAWAGEDTREALAAFDAEAVGQGRPGGVRGDMARLGREARAQRGLEAWEARLDREAVPQAIDDHPYVGASEQAQGFAQGSGREPISLPDGAPAPVTPVAPKETGHELWATLRGLHGAKDLPELPTTLKGLAKQAPAKAVKMGLTLNALGEHSADLEGRVQTMLGDLEKEMGVTTPKGETPAQRWMALRKAAREAGQVGEGKLPAYGKAKGPRAEPRTPESAHGRGFFSRWRRRLLGRTGEDLGRAAGGGTGLGAKVLGAGGREGGYLLAGLLAGPKGIGMAMGGKWLLKSRMAEVMMAAGKAGPEHLAPLSQTAVWLRDRKKAAREIIQLHQAGPQVGDLVYQTLRDAGQAGSAMTGALVQRATQVVSYLTSIAPKPGPGLNQLRWEPSLTAVLPLVQATEAVTYPTRALSRVLAGQAGTSAIKALWLAYPEAMTEVITQLMKLTNADLEKMPTVKRQALSMLMSSPLTSVSPGSPGAAGLRARLFASGPQAAGKVQQQTQAKAQGQGVPGRPAETTKLDAMLNGGRA